MIIRRARMSDAKRVARIYMQFWKAHSNKSPLHQPTFKINYENCLKDAKDVIKDKDYKLYIAVEGSEVVGFILMTIKKSGKCLKVRKYGHIEEAAVDKNHRRKGVARAMMNFVLDYFKKRGLKYAHIGVEVDLPIARKAWESMGFKQETIELVKKLK